MANLLHGNTHISFTEANIVLGLTNFLFKRLIRTSIETIRHNLTSYKNFFLWIVVQANESYMVRHYLFAWTAIHKKMLI